MSKTLKDSDSSSLDEGMERDSLSEFDEKEEISSEDSEGAVLNEPNIFPDDDKSESDDELIFLVNEVEKTRLRRTLLDEERFLMESQLKHDDYVKKTQPDNYENKFSELYELTRTVSGMAPCQLFELLYLASKLEYKCSFTVDSSKVSVREVLSYRSGYRKDEPSGFDNVVISIVTPIETIKIKKSWNGYCV